MNNTQERAGYSDEISLVDLAATFIRRRRVFYVTFVTVVLAALIYALLLPAKYEYVTLVQSAERADGEYLESPAATVATLNNRWIPEIASTYAAVNEQNLPFNLSPSNPEDTGLIRIASEATPELASLVEESQKTLAGKVLERQEQLLNRHRQALESQLTSLDEAIESLRSTGNGDSSGTALASAIQKRAELESLMQSLKPAEALVVSRQSVEQKGTSKRLVMALAILLGGMLGVFLVFAVEFLAQVRNRLSDLAEPSTD